jgi:hypothetical protein
VNKPAIWLGRALWLGVLVDWLRAIPAIFAPQWVLSVTGLGGTASPVWVAFSALLLFLLSLFYLPGAMDPYRSLISAKLAVPARLLLALFFLWLYPGQYPHLGLVDLVVFLIQLPLLIVLLRTPAPPGDIPEEGVPEAATQTVFEYDGSTFEEVREVVWREPYNVLPYHRGVGLGTFIQLFNASARNLADRRDIRPRFDKLIHINGICYTGVWRIDQDSPYTGYFARGAEGLVIARLSVAGQQIMRGQRRAFGIAGKVFPTLDRGLKVRPGNFVTVSHLSGTWEKHIINIHVTNQPTIGLDPAANLINRVIFRMMDTRPGYRLLHPLSTLGLKPGSKVVTPDLLMLRVRDGTPRIDAEDFREELRLKHYPNHTLVYTINVRSFWENNWTRIGTIEFTEDVVSEGGDKRLHFWIPQDIPNRN